MATVDILIPAAGSSRRMAGRDKLLETVGGVEQLRRVAAMAASFAFDHGSHVHVTIPATGPFNPARKRALMGLRVAILALPDAHEGMAASLRAGAWAARDAEGLLVLPADMPEIDRADLDRMTAVFGEDSHYPLRATTEDGAPGHPVIFPRRLLGELMVLSGDQGGRAVLRDEEVRTCPLAGQRARVDLDTQEDWENWRARTGN
ncbi:MAG: nucleotidyltransferase family protein [Rhodobacteraceae bacterium]|nr:nucleotidyltransferase family protein [Paracoccaceae bacterium]MCP5340601.1 nucleotidyltransferase family protein [Paracoccaceae bacterium]